jgi:peroxiredoxin (alkyl hydroperoxide reductase subunit C)
MTEDPLSCTEPTQGPITPQNGEILQNNQPQKEEVPRMAVQVGKPAPDFESVAYIDGGFKNIKLSDFKGQWVVLCFYPGDFTFV